MPTLYINSLRVAVKALEKEIAELSRVRRGLSPAELTTIRYDLESAREAKAEIINYIKDSGFSL